MKLDMQFSKLRSMTKAARLCRLGSWVKFFFYVALILHPTSSVFSCPFASMPSKLSDDLGIMHMDVLELILDGLVDSIKIEARNISRSTLVLGPHFGYLSLVVRVFGKKAHY